MSEVIRVNTSLLNEYSLRIDRVNSRLLKVNEQVKRLHYNVPVMELRSFMNVAALTVCSLDLRKCSSYLKEAASVFEYAEETLSSNADILNYQGLKPNVFDFVTDYISREKRGVVKSDELKKWFSILTEYVGDNVQNYVDNFDKYKNSSEAVVGWYAWFQKDVYKDLKGFKTFIENAVEEYTFKKPELLPNGSSDFFDDLSDGQALIDTVNELKEYYQTGDGWKAYKEIGLTFFEKALEDGNKWLDEKINLKYLGVDKQIQSVLISAIPKMTGNYIDGIENYAKKGVGSAGSIFVDTTIGALGEATAEGAKPVYVAATAVTYPLADQICESIGYDLSGEYEKLSGKTGVSAILSAQKELWVDTVYSGFKENASKAVDGLYENVETGWNSWKSGMKMIFGKD